MSTTHTRGILTAAAAIVLAASAISITAAAQAADHPTGAGNHGDRNTALADAFNGVDRNTNWQQTSKLKLNFPTYHTEGIAYSQDHIFLSAVQIIEPTVKFPTPQNGFDRTPGKGVGHLFVMDKAGALQKDIVLGEGDMYHPGGIDFDGTNVWIPVAQYRPDSSAIIYRVDATTLDVHKQFEVKDHFGGIVMDKQTGHLVGNTWGSRRFAEWDLQGKQLSTWQNPNYTLRAPGTKPPSGDFCVVWEGTEAELRSLLATVGASVEEGPVERRGARKVVASSIYTRDPDGNLLEFMSY